MNTKTFHVILIASLIVLIVASCIFIAGLIPLLKKTSFGSYSTTPTFYASGTTNSSTTVNTTSTLVIPGTYSVYAQISNSGSNVVWCYLDNQTAASSSVQVNAGIKIGMVSSTFAGEVMACFGSGPTCIPYFGAINCIAAGKTVVGVTYH